MGEVFLARDTTLERQVALKFLPEELQQDAGARARFLREAKSAAALDHPYVCKLYEISGEGVEPGAESGDDRSFIAMEYVQGETLAERLRRGPLALDVALRLASEIAEALETAHGQGIVHRDLKPAKIMVTESDHVKVLDFGLAKRVESPHATGSELETEAQITGAGVMMGTPAYMSPEQMRAETVDRRSDIFSFGVVLYEMLTGTHPFAKDTSIDTDRTRTRSTGFSPAMRHGGNDGTGSTGSSLTLIRADSTDAPTRPHSSAVADLSTLTVVSDFR